MALPFLPHRQISNVFVRFQAEAQTEPLQSLLAYIRQRWVESAMFLQKNWSCTSRPSEPTMTLRDGTMLWFVVWVDSADYLCTHWWSSWTERQDLLQSPSGLCLIRNWSGSSGNSIKTCRRGHSTAGRSSRGRRRPLHCCSQHAYISKARVVGTEEVIRTQNRKNSSFRSHQVCKRKWPELTINKET